MTEEEAVTIVDGWAASDRDYDRVRDVARTLRQALAEAQGEVVRLNTWADGFSDAQLKERRLCEERIHEIEAERDALRRRIDAAASLLDDLPTDSSGRVDWADVANAQRHLRDLTDHLERQS